MKASPERSSGLVWWWAGTALLAAALVLVARSVDPATFATTWRAAAGAPAAIAAVLSVYGAAFVLRAWVWTRLVPPGIDRQGVPATRAGRGGRRQEQGHGGEETPGRRH
ncbi:MAG: hypothetical protein M3217_02650, partial [Actinomycetota bacterium]|nr:hypothetical protein [Actinomycetota bacterium]